jgi:hypothetical protein
MFYHCHPSSIKVHEIARHRLINSTVDSPLPFHPFPYVNLTLSHINMPYAPFLVLALAALGSFAVVIDQEGLPDTGLDTTS